MTIIEKERIATLRHRGLSYLQIAKSLNISENTVKSYCRRNNLGIKPKSQTEIVDKCKHCGKSLIAGTKGQPKKFCSEDCRRTWWKSNDSQLFKKAYYSFICAHCGKEYESYGNESRKYCGHACYIAHRFMEGGNDDVSRAV